MVFRAESEFDRVAADGRGDGASDGRDRDAAMEVLNKAQAGMPVLQGRSARSSGGIRTPHSPINLYEYQRKGLTEYSFRKSLILKGTILVVPQSKRSFLQTLIYQG